MQVLADRVRRPPARLADHVIGLVEWTRRRYGGLMFVIVCVASPSRDRWAWSDNTDWSLIHARELPGASTTSIS